MTSGADSINGITTTELIGLGNHECGYPRFWPDEIGIGKRFKTKGFQDFSVTLDRQKTILEKIGIFLKCPDANLILSGKPGTGKTHLIAAIARHLIVCEGLGKSYYRCSYTLKDYPRVMIRRAFDLIREIKGTWGLKYKSEENRVNPTEASLLQVFSEIDLLIIDEIGVDIGSNTEKMFITEIVDRRYEAEKKTILSTNLSHKELENVIGERAMDRMVATGLLGSFNWDSQRRIYDGPHA